MNTSLNNSVTELQQWLRTLHFAGYGVDLIIPDGIYGEDTRRAVSQFQQIIGLPVTGIVDRATWDALYEANLIARLEASRPNAIYPFPERGGYVLSPGEVSDIVMIVQLMLDTLSAHYDKIDVEPTGTYDAATRRAVEIFQEKNGLRVTGEIDKTTWNRLAEVYNRFNNIDT
ncbi:MAG: peptidoglycan-binding protein [Clostridia bacterium]|nr:peptidoglycan-binding protein [Clostridia bacterium]